MFYILPTPEVEGVYLFTSGIPDQQADICCDYVEEAAAGRELKVWPVALYSLYSALYFWACPIFPYIFLNLPYRPYIFSIILRID